jgi:hypothetical protein
MNYGSLHQISGEIKKGNLGMFSIYSRFFFFITILMPRCIPWSFYPGDFWIYEDVTSSDVVSTLNQQQDGVSSMGRGF